MTATNLRWLCFVGLLGGALGCAPDRADVTTWGGTAGGKADDLVGRRLILHARPGVRTTAVPSYLRVSPTVDEHWSSVEVWTDDVRIDRSLVGVRATVKVIGLGGDYGMVLQARGPGTAGVWVDVPPVWHDADYYWTRVEGVLENDELVLEGRAMKIEDVNWGITRMLHPKDVRVVPPADAAELRFLLIPLWNFWDWDASGYDGLLMFDPVK